MGRDRRHRRHRERRRIVAFAFFVLFAGICATIAFYVTFGPFAITAEGAITGAVIFLARLLATLLLQSPKHQSPWRNHPAVSPRVPSVLLGMWRRGNSMSVDRRTAIKALLLCAAAALLSAGSSVAYAWWFSPRSEPALCQIGRVTAEDYAELLRTAQRLQRELGSPFAASGTNQLSTAYTERVARIGPNRTLDEQLATAHAVLIADGARFIFSAIHPLGQEDIRYSYRRNFRGLPESICTTYCDIPISIRFIAANSSQLLRPLEGTRAGRANIFVGSPWGWKASYGVSVPRQASSLDPCPSPPNPDVFNY